MDFSCRILEGGWRPGRLIDRYRTGWQALDDAAVATHEVRMSDGVAVPVACGFEPPDVVSDIGSFEQCRLGEIHEIAIDRRAVEAFVAHRFEDLGVRHGAPRHEERSQDSHPSGGRSEPGFSKPLAKGLVWVLIAHVHEN